MSKVVSRRFKSLMVMVIVVFTAIFTPLSSFQAQSYNEFSVTPSIPANQIDKTKTYFDLGVAPNQSQELEIVINNTGTEEMIADVELFSALTANNGGLIYTQVGDADTSLTKPITNYATVKTPQVSVPANGSQKAIIDLQFGEETFDGVSLGGIVVKASTAVESANNSTEPIQLQNEVAYVIGLKLSMDPTVGATNLNLLDTRAELIDYRTSIIANVQNDQSIIMKDATITGEIYAQNSTKAISSVDLKTVDIAPNTNFNVVFDWNNNQIAEGKYRIHIKAEHLGVVWEWDEDFTVGSEAAVVNDNAFEINSKFPTAFIIGGIILVIILIGITIFIILKKKKQAE